MYEKCMKYMDQFVNQNVNLVLIGKHSGPLTAVIFDWRWPKGPLSVVNTTLSLPDHRTVENSKGKNWGVPGMGNDILTSAIPLRL